MQILQKVIHLKTQKVRYEELDVICFAELSDIDVLVLGIDLQIITKSQFLLEECFKMKQFNVLIDSKLSAEVSAIY